MMAIRPRLFSSYLVLLHLLVGCVPKARLGTDSPVDGFLGVADLARASDASAPDLNAPDLNAPDLNAPDLASLHPAILVLQISKIEHHRATLFVITAVPTKVRVAYDLNAWPKEAASRQTSTDHELVLDHLLSDERHDARITIEDSEGSLLSSVTRSFWTKSYVGALPNGWRSLDIGEVNPNLPGSASYDDSIDGGIYAVRGTGYQIWENQNGHVADSFHFVFKEVDGNFRITFKIASYHGYLHSFTKALVMFRVSTAANSPFLTQSVNYGGNDFLYYRSQVTETAAIGVINERQLQPEAGAPLWLRMQRVGNAFKVYYSLDGIDWRLNSEDPPSESALPRKGLVGFGVVSKDNQFLSEILYSHVVLEAPFPG